MGVADLRKLAVIETTSLERYADQAIAIDASHWLYRYMSVQVRYTDAGVYTTQHRQELPNLVGILRGLPTLLRSGIIPVFVFDGVPSDLKREEIAKRQASAADARQQMEAAQKEGDVEAARRYKAQTQLLTPTIQETSRELFELLGVPYAEADGAGEGYAAELANSHDAFDAALTADYDSLLFGCEETVRPTTGSNQYERLQLGKLLAKHGLTRPQLVNAAILIGTDYNSGVTGIGPKRAVKYLQDGQTAEEIAADWDSDLSPARIDAVRDIFLNPPTGELQHEPTVSDPAFDRAEQYLTQTWEFPQETVREELQRFPRYS